MFKRRNPELLSQYLCSFCGERIKWGAILRIMRIDPGQPGYMGWELYGHRDCLRDALRPEVPLTFGRFWNGRQPMPDDEDQIEGRPCGICADPIAPADLTRLRIQEPHGLVKKPEFMEESVPVHTLCLRRATGRDG
jgi:hypothetical protein